MVITSDEGLEAEFGPVQQEAPVVYGGVDITEPEAAVAGLGPKFCVTPRLSMEDSNPIFASLAPLDLEVIVKV